MNAHPGLNGTPKETCSGPRPRRPTRGSSSSRPSLPASGRRSMRSWPGPHCASPPGSPGGVRPWGGGLERPHSPSRGFVPFPAVNLGKARRVGGPPRTSTPPPPVLGGTAGGPRRRWPGSPAAAGAEGPPGPGDVAAGRPLWPSTGGRLGADRGHACLWSAADEVASEWPRPNVTKSAIGSRQESTVRCRSQPRGDHRALAAGVRPVPPAEGPRGVLQRGQPPHQRALPRRRRRCPAHRTPGTAQGGRTGALNNIYSPSLTCMDSFTTKGLIFSNCNPQITCASSRKHAFPQHS